MADFALSDVNVIAVSLCKGPATRKRFWLKKQEGEPELTLPARHAFIKADDWKVVYAIVAEPGHEEQPGVGAGATPGTTDIWANEDEIRFAAHRFIKNGGLINRSHEDQFPYGTLVENFIAPVDMEIEGAQIKKGSWCIGIEPTDEGRRLIESGEWDGVSYEGDGIRTPISKGKDNDTAATHGKCANCGGKTKRGAKTCTNCGRSAVAKEDGTITEVDDRSLLRKIADKLGISVEDETDTLNREEDMTDAERAQLEKVEALEGQLTDLTKEDGRLAAIESSLQEIKDALPKPDEPDEREALVKQMEKLESDHASLNDKLEKLGEGDTSQDDKPDELRKKDDPKAALAHALLD